MLNLGTLVVAAAAAGVAYVTRVIGPKVRKGDEVLIGTAGLAGLPAAYQMYPALLLSVSNVHDGFLDGTVVGTGAATLGNTGVVQVVRLPVTSLVRDIPEKFVLPNKFQG